MSLKVEKEIALAEKEMDILQYLPPVVGNIRECKAVARAENPQLQRLWGALDGGLKDQFVLDSTIHGVKRMEAILNIFPKGSESPENRKRRILARMNETLPYTFRKLESWLVGVCGDNDFLLELEHVFYRLNLSLFYLEDTRLQEIYSETKKMIPANLELIFKDILLPVEFKNNFAAILQSIQFTMGIRNLGIQYIALDGTRNLDGGWNIDFFFRSVKLFEFNMQNNSYNHNLLLLAKMVTLTALINKDKAILNRLSVFTFTRNLGLEYVRLDGEKLLDGSWNIDFHNRSVKLPRLQMGNTIYNQNELFVAKMALLTAFLNQQGSTLTEIRKYSIKNQVYSGAKEMVVGVGKQNLFLIKYKGFLHSSQILNDCKAIFNSCKMAVAIKNLDMNYISSQKFGMRNAFSNVIGVSGKKLHIVTGFFNKNNSSTVQQHKYAVKNKEALAAKEAVIYAGKKHVFSTKCTLVMDTMGYLNGSEKMNGSRRLNAKVNGFDL